MNATEVILKRFSQLNSTTLEQEMTVENVTLDHLQSLGTDGDFVNTRADIYPVSGGGFSGTAAIAWKRLNLSRLFAEIPISITTNAATTTRDLVPIVNAMFGTTIPPEEIALANLPLAAQNALVPLTAAPTSVYLVGSFTLRYTKSM